MSTKYQKVSTFEHSGVPVVAAAAFPWATVTATVTVTATAAVGVYYGILAPAETAAHISCAVLPTCSQLGFL